MQDKIYKNKEWLYEQYIILKKSSPRIAKECGSSYTTINHWLKEFDIKVRTLKESNTKLVILIEKLGYDYFYERYILNQESARQIGKDLNIADGTIAKILKKLNIKLRKELRKDLKDMTGKTVGLLKVIKRDTSRKDVTSAYWICKCRCGNTTSTIGTILNKNEVYSCGCKGQAFGDISGLYWAALKEGASRRNLKFNITIEYAWNLFLKQNGCCKLSGTPITLFRASDMKSSQTASLDRINSLVPYIESNVQWIHKDLNTMKMDTSQEEFINWCHKIHYYQLQKSDEQIEYQI